MWKVGEKGILRVAYLSVAGFEGPRYGVFGHVAGSAKQIGQSWDCGGCGVSGWVTHV